MTVVKIGCRPLPHLSKTTMEVVNQWGDRYWVCFGHTLTWLGNDQVGVPSKTFSWVNGPKAVT